MDKEKRMAGDYEIIHAMQIGDLEIVVGENLSATAEHRYMCAHCESNILFERFDDVMVSDDYTKIISLYGQRITQQAVKTRTELHCDEVSGISNEAITAKTCTLISSADDLHNKVIVIKPEVLRREYQTATHQVMLCDGGFGASPNSRGSACHSLTSIQAKQADLSEAMCSAFWKELRFPSGRRKGWSDISRNGKRKGYNVLLNVNQKGGGYAQ